MKDNIFSWFFGYMFTNLSILNGWIQVATLIEVAVYGFIGGLAGLLAKYLVQYVKSKLNKS